MGSGAGAQAGAPDPERAHACFEEARALAERDGGALWGKPLGGPLLFVEPGSRAAAGSIADAGGVLTPCREVFCGTLPADLPLANTALEWSGRYWTMVLWPLPEKAPDRMRLLGHEMFHRLQRDLGLVASSPPNAHLDRKDGRIWMRLEMRALAVALSEEERRELAVEDALVFRALRARLFPGAAEEEEALERNEGMAEYTGLRLCGLSGEEQRVHAAARLRGEEQNRTFARSFAYATGPAYGLLLDGCAPDWRAAVKEGRGPAVLLAELHALPGDAELLEEAQMRCGDHGGEEVQKEEERRETERVAREERARQRFFEGPVLVLPLTEAVQYSFDPYQVETLDERLSLYRHVQVTDAFGSLEATEEVLLVREEGRPRELRVALPDRHDVPASLGEGVTLSLAAGQVLERGERPDEWRAVPRR
jgi:hypothetical protein